VRAREARPSTSRRHAPSQPRRPRLTAQEQQLGETILAWFFLAAIAFGILLTILGATEVI
jgi:hypothetical protein